MTWRFDNGEVNGSVYHEEKNNFVGKIFQQFVSSSQAMMYGEILHKEYAVLLYQAIIFGNSQNPTARSDYIRWLKK